MVRLTVHGYNRLIAEELLIECPGCNEGYSTRPGHHPDDRYFHVDYPPDEMDLDEAVGIAVDVLAEALH